jgi:hypothetical protein
LEMNDLRTVYYYRLTEKKSLFLMFLYISEGLISVM